MEKVWIVIGLNKIRQVEAEIDGDRAIIPLALGGSKVVRRPRWQDSEARAQEVVAHLRQKRLQSLQKQIKALDSA